MTSSPSEAVNFGKSLIVPSVQELAKHPIVNIPTRYVRPDPDISLFSDNLNHMRSIPVIDLQSLINTTGESENHELEKLHMACKEWGFFQVAIEIVQMDQLIGSCVYHDDVNIMLIHEETTIAEIYDELSKSNLLQPIEIIHHGVSTSFLETLRTEVTDFFKLTIEEKKKLWQQPDNHEGFGQLFVVSEEQKLDWSDMFYITTLPINLRKIELFEKLPTKLRELLEAHSAEMKKLAMMLLGKMAKALNIDDEEMRELFNDGVQSMRMNLYPPCPEPDIAIGFTPHSDADAITVLFQLNDTEGLQIRKDGKWVPVKPLPDAFVVNLGDIMEIVSNGVYRSVEHRAVVNSSKERLSVATFYSSNLDSELGPARSIVGPNNPPLFRRMPIDDYFKNFFARKLDGKSYRDFMKLEAAQEHYDAC